MTMFVVSVAACRLAGMPARPHLFAYRTYTRHGTATGARGAVTFESFTVRSLLSPLPLQKRHARRRLGNDPPAVSAVNRRRQLQAEEHVRPKKGRATDAQHNAAGARPGEIDRHQSVRCGHARVTAQVRIRPVRRLLPPASDADAAKLVGVAHDDAAVGKRIRQTARRVEDPRHALAIAAPVRAAIAVHGTRDVGKVGRRHAVRAHVRVVERGRGVDLCDDTPGAAVDGVVAQQREEVRVQHGGRGRRGRLGRRRQRNLHLCTRAGAAEELDRNDAIVDGVLV
mmetsp:Transcript_11396/g.37424  ORF Transcript_11396/g.37424 Transcript_11396/m.37424 type:complete len:283 (+) Transcript_11396:2213-3061(+)